MNLGGEIEDRVRVIVRFIGVLAPLALGLYGYMVSLGYAPSEHFSSIAVFLSLSVVWSVYGIWQYFWPSKWRYQPLLTLCLYHVFGIAFILFVTGFSMFALASWAILALAMYLYYNTYGYALSIGVLVLTAAIDIAIHSPTTFDSSVMLLNIIGVVFISGAASAIVYAYRLQHTSLTTTPQPQSTDHQRLVTVVNNLADAVFVTDTSGSIELYNAASLNLLDTNANISDKSIDEVLQTRSTDGEPRSILDELRQAKHVIVDDGLITGPQDDPTRLELTYAPIRSTYRGGKADQGSEGYIIIARDVTKEKSLEEERDEFISVVSHELRTPVTVAEGSISNAKALIEHGKDSKQSLNDALDEAHSQVLFLAGMINDLSTLSRAERGVAAEHEEIDVAEFVHDIYNEYLPEAQKQNLHFNLELKPGTGAVLTSRLYLHELLQNFITNAIKYTREGSITLSVTTNEGMVQFSVADTGIGISKSDQTKIFNKFYRSEDYRTRETSGTGLGLYVANKLAKKLKTTISVKSRLNHGSTFSITLPNKAH